MNRPNAATQRGNVWTSTALAATVVNDSEEIHVAKCADSTTPEASASCHCRFDSRTYSSRCRASPSGTSTTEAIAHR